MRRAVLTLGGTAAGLAALLSFKTHSPAAAAPDPVTPAAASPAVAGGTGPATSAAAGTGAIVGATAGASAGATAGGTAGGGTSAATRTATGAVANTPYGPMQVKITLTGQRITQVTVLQQTDSGAMSQQIDSFALPKLTAETLTAQSARIDAVSGASYTSSGYIQSLQSALDQAKG
jgi:uncharacterized protein with FMN-binding domain